MSWRLRLIFIIPAVLGVLAIPARIHAGGPPVKIAAVLPETGIASSLFEPAGRGALLAADKVNRAGGVLGRPLEIIVLDNQSTPLGSKAAAEAVLAAGVAAVVGAHWSSHSLPLAEVLQKAGVPMVSPQSSHPQVTLVGDYIFRVCFTDSFQGRIMARFALTDLEARRAALLRNLNEIYSLTLGEEFTEVFRAGGGEVWEGGYKGMAADFAELLTATKDFHPQVVFIPGYSRDSGLLVKQAAQMGVAALFLGGDGWGREMHDYAGRALAGAFHSTHWDPQAPHPANREFLEEYKTAYGGSESLDPAAPLTYDAVLVLAAAIARAGSDRPDKIRAALAETRGFLGATGTITFDVNGDPVDKEAVIMKSEKGSWVFWKSVKP
ncbi:MAG: ABC transporter substrate-binding protein [Thermodesulfobacteriota bacterium]